MSLYIPLSQDDRRRHGQDSLSVESLLTPRTFAAVPRDAGTLVTFSEFLDQILH